MDRAMLGVVLKTLPSLDDGLAGQVLLNVFGAKK